MGSPLSSILSEVFLQHQEEEILEELKKKHEIITYIRYVDDILLIFRGNEKEAEDMLNTFNSHHKNLAFTMEHEENCQINYLDLTLERRLEEINFNIYRKPTQTNTTINSKSIHPTSHKTAAFRAMLYRAFKIPLNEENRRREIKTIKEIAQANGFRPTIIDEIGTQIKRKIRNQDKLHSTTTLYRREDNSTGFATFNYTGKRTQNIANRFKKYGLSIAFRTSNTMNKILNPKIEDCNKFDMPGIYEINCNDCEKVYIGQTVNFIKRFKNHISAWNNRKPERSNVAKHLIENGHTITNIEENLKILKNCKKGNTMNAWEELYIFKENCKNREKLINEHVNFESSCTYRNLYPELPVTNSI